MKTILLILLVPILALAQSPSPTPPPSGYFTGIKEDGTSVWSKPMWGAPPVIYGHAPLFISGSTAPTLEQVQLVFAKKRAIRALADSYSAALSAGITVTSGSLTVTLAAGLSDQQMFNELLTLLNTAPMPPALTIADVNGNPQKVTVAQYYALIGNYGQQIATLWSALITAKSSVAAATDAAALAKITLADPTGE